jgi:Mannosylglycerate hydrolase MGH1-like glycoside hydrolase domain
MRCSSKSVNLLLIIILIYSTEVYSMKTPANVDSWNLDDLCHYGERGGTLGPTGKRLSADFRKEGIGLTGRYCYLHYGTDLEDLARIDISENGKALDFKPTSRAWYPTHFEYSCKRKKLEISESKFITDDDVAVDILTLTNNGKQARALDIEVSSGFANLRMNSATRSLDLSKYANLDPAPPDCMSPFTTKTVSYAYWWNAERPHEQRGSKGRDRKRAASGGEVLGYFFGSWTGHFAEYIIDLPTLPQSLLWARASRLDVGNASWSIELDGQPIGNLDIDPTGGWGDKATDFWMVCLPLPAVKAGTHTIRIISNKDANNTNFDGFLISDMQYAPPELGSPPPFSATATPRFMFEPGVLHFEGLTYRLINGQKNKHKSLLAVGGVSNLPERIEIPIPKSQQVVDQIHILGQTGGFLEKAEPGVTVGNIRVLFTDGREQVIPLVAGETFPDNTGQLGKLRPQGIFNSLSVLLEERGKLKSIVFESGGTGVAPVLAAITLESFEPKDTRWTASREMFGRIVHGVLDGRLRGAKGRSIAGKHGRAGKRFSVNLKPGESATLTVANALSESEKQSASRVRAWLGQADPLSLQKQQYTVWFDDNCPRLQCSDPYIEKLWKYRWFVARHCLSRAETGYLQEPCFFEGMHWYNRLISYSSPHIMSEVRWLRDPKYAFGQVRNHALMSYDTGNFRDGIINRKDTFYTNWICKTTWESYMVHPDREFLAEIAPAMASDTLGLLKVCDENNNKLLAPSSHWPTGMEWQPSFWYFDRFDNTQKESKLERVDFVSYHYANARATALAFAELDDASQALQFDELADEIRAQCLKWMWDPQDRFFYSVRESDQAVALCREIVGFYPFFAMMPPDEPQFTDTLRYMIDEEEFWNPYPLATVTKRNPAYTPSQMKWPGPGGKITGCMWNGPTWPHANSIIAESMARAIQSYDQDIITPKVFWKFMDRFTHLQFLGDDINSPMIQEYYDGVTAKPQGCRDYFHSTYNDIIIRYLCGIEPSPEPGVVRLNPIPSKVRYFRLDNIRYHGHDLTVIWNPKDKRGKLNGMKIPKGYSLFIDGKLAAKRGKLGPLEAVLE